MKQCFDCAGKHIAKAMVLFDELQQGYEENAPLIIGNLALAEDHTLYLGTKAAGWAEKVRDARLMFEKSGSRPPFDTLFIALQVLKNTAKDDDNGA
jgi:hypothetical protein